MPTKDVHLPEGKTMAFYFEMVKKPSDLSGGPVAVKMKLQREDCLSQTLSVTYSYEYYKHWSRRVAHS